MNVTRLQSWTLSTGRGQLLHREPGTLLQQHDGVRKPWRLRRKHTRRARDRSLLYSSDRPKSGVVLVPAERPDLAVVSVDIWDLEPAFGQKRPIAREMHGRRLRPLSVTPCRSMTHVARTVVARIRSATDAYARRRVTCANGRSREPGGKASELGLRRKKQGPIGALCRVTSVPLSRRAEASARGSDGHRSIPERSRSDPTHRCVRMNAKVEKSFNGSPPFVAQQHRCRMHGASSLYFLQLPRSIARFRHDGSEMDLCRPLGAAQCWRR